MNEQKINELEQMSIYEKLQNINFNNLWIYVHDEKLENYENLDTIASWSPDTGNITIHPEYTMFNYIEEFNIKKINKEGLIYVR